jgi:hypothetical protein
MPWTPPISYSKHWAFGKIGTFWTGHSLHPKRKREAIDDEARLNERFQDDYQAMILMNVDDRQLV